MARPLRVEYPGALYHVMSRGNDHQTIFETSGDCRHLLDLLTDLMGRYEVILYAYALMGNHYHLVVQTAHPNLHEFMHDLNTAYTIWVNRRHNRSGHLFEGRYKAIVMEDAGYLLAATGYVHLNPARVRGWKTRPVKERLKRVQEYPWSSYSAYVRAVKGKTPPISCDRVWGELGARKANEGRKAYRKYMLGWLRKEEEERKRPKKERDESLFNPFSEVRLGCCLGSDRFRDYIYDHFIEDRELSAEVVGSRFWRKEIALPDLLDGIAEIMGLSKDDLLVRGRNHVDRDAAMYLCREAGQKGLREIGEGFGIGSAAVSLAVKRTREKRRKEKRFAKKLGIWRASLIERFMVGNAVIR